MRKQRLAAAALLLAALAALAGCMRYENAIDFNNVTGTTSPWATQPGVSVPATEPYAIPATQPGETWTAPTQTSVPTTNAGEQPAVPGTTAAAPGVSAPANSEYEILRSGTFTMAATLCTKTEEQPMNMSVSKNGDLYMEADISGLNMGILVKNGKVYMLYPPEKKYLELNSIVTGLLKINPDDFTSVAKDMGFDQMRPLSEADSAEAAVFRGNPCTRYHVSYEDGRGGNVYLAGTRLLGVENLDTNGDVESTLVVSSISAGFPSLPPSDYTKSGYMDFFKIIYNNMDTE